jgi:hypothetical protein
MQVDKQWWQEVKYVHKTPEKPLSQPEQIAETPGMIFVQPEQMAETPE